MATFAQWLQKKDLTSRVFWITGSRIEFINYVFEFYCNAFSYIPEVVTIYGDGSDLWETVFQQAVTSERVIKIVNAELIPEIEWKRFAEFRGNYKLSMHARMIVKEYVEEKINTKLAKYRPFIEKGKGVFVNCQLLNDSDIIEFVKLSFEDMINVNKKKGEKREEYAEKLAKYLVENCGSQDAVIQSIKRFQSIRIVPMTNDSVDRLAVQSYESLLTDCLLKKDFNRAIRIVETGRVSQNLFIGSISYRLLQVALLIYYRGKKLSSKKELLDMTGIPIFKLAELTDMAKGMTFARLKKYSDLLLTYDGVKDQIGALHWLVASWR